MRNKKKKNIILCGATHGSNFGDSLFALMFQKFIHEKFKDTNIYFTKVSPYSNKILKIQKCRLVDLVKADAFVYISGGYFGESCNESLKRSIFRFINYYSYGILMIILRKPIAIIGVGAGPLNRWFLKKTAIYIFNRANVASVRDEQSREYLLDYGIKKEVIVTSDAAQSLDILKVLMGNTNFLLKKNNSNKIILIHFMPSIESNTYVEYIRKVLENSFFIDKSYSFIITYDSLGDGKRLENLSGFFPKNRTLIYHYNDPIEFLGVINNADIIITPKLHLGILGSTFGKVVFAFPVHTEKTIRYYKQIGYLDHCISINEVDTNYVVEFILSSLNKNIILDKKVIQMANYNFLLLSDFLNDV